MNEKTCVQVCMKRVNLTLDEATLSFLKDLVASGECASLSHAVRVIVGRYLRGLETRGAEG